jgi:hypothetical protein
VVAELQPLGEPDEYVNLSPTTGPVPVMIPNSPRPAPSIAPPADAEVLDPDEAVEAVEAVDADTVEDLDAVESAADEPTVEDIEVVEEVGGAEDNGVAEDDGEPYDDVVVDLFARLRAESVVIVPDDDDEVMAAEIVEVEVVAEIDVDDDADAPPTPFERRDADVTPIIVSSARKLKRVLADEQNEVLDALRRSEPVRELQMLLPGAAEHVERYRVAIDSELAEAANAGATMVGRSAKLSKANTAAAVAASGSVLADWLVQPLRERLERCVADGDADNAGISKRVRAVYREWKTQHIDEQLDDVILAAHGRGVLAAIAPGTPVVWVCDAATTGCADCDDNSLAGPIPAGQAFPTGSEFAPAHVGCRCLLLPDGS